MLPWIDAASWWVIVLGIVAGLYCGPLVGASLGLGGLALLAIAELRARWNARRRPAPDTRCPRCRYELLGSRYRCPECGWTWLM